MSSTYSVERLRRATLHFVGGRALQALARAALVLLVVRLLPVADYGAYMLIVGIAEMLLQLCSFGLVPVGQRFLPQLVETASIRDTCRFLGAVTLLQLLVLGLVAGLFWWSWQAVLPHMGFTAEQIQRTRPATLLFLLVPAFRFVADLLEALLEQGKAQAARALMPLGRMLGIVLVLGLGVDVTLERLLLVDGAVTLMCLLLAWLLMAVSLRRLEPPPRPQPLPVRAMARHAWHMAAVGVMTSTQEPGALRMVLANALGIVDSGLFAFLQSLQRLVGRYLPGALLRGLVRPMLISRAGRSDGLRLVERGAGLLMKGNLLIVVAAAVLVSFAGDRLVLLASGSKFTDAGDTLLLMLLALACTSQRQVIEMVMQVLNQTHVLRLTAVLAPLTLAVMWLVAGGVGLNAAIVALALGVAAANAANLWRLRAHTGRFAADWWGAVSILLPAVAAAALGHLVNVGFGLPAAAAVAGIALLGSLLLTKPFAAGDLQIADRGLGPMGRRVLQPFVRRVTT